MRFPPQSPCSLPESAANRIVPAAPGGCGPALSEREGKMQTPSIPLLKEERKNRTPPFPAYCVGLPQPVHFTRRASRSPSHAPRRQHKAPQIASHRSRPAGAGPLSARAGRKNANTAISSVSGRTERRHFPHTAAVCRLPAHAPRTAHFTRQRPARLAHPRRASRGLRPQARRAQSQGRASHRRAARKAKAAPYPSAPALTRAARL